MNEQDIFTAALQQPPDARPAFLDGACAGDPKLRERIECLLELHQSPGEFFEKPAAAVLETEVPRLAQQPGDPIGPYKLLQKIGEGGMGVVYMAEQTAPLERRVALKIIKPGMDTRQVIARFEAERQALAMMDHPNIAKVLDAGATGEVEGPRSRVQGQESPHPSSLISHPSSRPYFVMELVKGLPITQYCDEQHLTPRERLELFLPICQAVQHAHQKGIIHRDLKPSNILVARYDDKAVPKIIDFGVAKAVSQRLTERTMFTQYGQIVGTIEYMSPEQAQFNQLDVDTRSDIYSLGVLLYELLTGETPFDKQRLRTAAFDELLRIIREEEPPRPSTRLSSSETLPSIAANRKMEPKKLSTLVRGELDWIVMKALEKDRGRRYETASAFAADVLRYLNDGPVLACPPSAAYRLKKFARRNKSAFVVCSLVACLLFTFVGGLGWLVRDREARQSRSAARVESILSEVTRLTEVQKWIEALAAARRAEAILDGGGADRETHQKVRETLDNLILVQRLEEIRLGQSAMLQDGGFDHATADRAYAAAFRQCGIDVENLPLDSAAAMICERAIAMIPLTLALDDWVESRRLTETADETSWKRLVAISMRVDPDPLRNRLRQLWGRRVTDESTDTLVSLASRKQLSGQPPATFFLVSSALHRAGQLEKSITVLRLAQLAHPTDFWVNFQLGARLADHDETDALRFCSIAAALRPDCAIAHRNLGVILQKLGKQEEAIASFRSAIDRAPNDPIAYCELGNLLTNEEDLSAAEQAFRAAIDLQPEDMTVAMNARFNLAVVLTKQGRLDEATDAYQRLIDLDPDSDPGVYANLAAVLRDRGRPADAADRYRKAIELDPNRAEFHDQLGALLSNHSGDHSAAEEALRRAIALQPDNAKTHFNLAVVFAKQGRWEDAISSCRQIIAIDNNHAGGHNLLGQALIETGAVDEAVVVLRRAIDLDPQSSLAHNNLGRALARQGNLEEAADCFRDAIKCDAEYAHAHANLGGTLTDLGRFQEAVLSYREAIRLDPANAGAYVSLGALLSNNLGEHASAESLFREAAAREPHNVTAQFNLAVVLYKQLKLVEAISTCRIVLELDPQHSEAARMVEDIQRDLARADASDLDGTADQ